jgi:predicted dithiol-disulfide oxidoreductase (DUF899 family)
MCTNWLGAVNGNAADTKERVALKIRGRLPVARQIAFATERGWRHLDFVAQHRSNIFRQCLSSHRFSPLTSGLDCENKTET